MPLFYPAQQCDESLTSARLFRRAGAPVRTRYDTWPRGYQLSAVSYQPSSGMIFSSDATRAGKSTVTIFQRISGSMVSYP